MPIKTYRIRTKPYGQDTGLTAEVVFDKSHATPFFPEHKLPSTGDVLREIKLKDGYEFDAIVLGPPIIDEEKGEVTIDIEKLEFTHCGQKWENITPKDVAAILVRHGWWQP